MSYHLRIAEILASVVAERTVTAYVVGDVGLVAGALMSLQFWLAGVGPADLEA